MKDQALALARQQADPAGRLNIVREYLQALTLRSLHESEAFSNLAFVGGTALRFLYSLPRFSEDLDFSLQQQEGYAPEAWMKKVQRDLRLAGFEVAVTFNARTTVHKSWVKVAGLLKETGLSPLASQNLSIRLEIDTHPPAGATCARTVVNRHRLLALQHRTLPSLMAGKLHALLQRGYPKGRDWYDLLWYLSQRPPVEPNLVQLQNALDQTAQRSATQAGNWREALLGQVVTMDCAALVDDVQPFLERPDEAALLIADNLAAVLRPAR